MYPKITDRKIRFAIIGCGQIFPLHFASYQAHHEDLELVAVCEPDPDIAQDCQARYGCKVYDDLASVLAQEDLDLVSLCTPSGLHPQQTTLAARHGVHVLTEKPMAIRWEEGLEMLQACHHAGVRLFVVMQNRYNATLRAVKRAVNAGRFGRIHMVHSNVFWHRPQAYYDGAAWRGTKALDGGTLLNHAVHYVDLLHWLIGPVAKVHAMTGTTRDIEVEDTAVLNITWREGALGSMAVTMLTHQEDIEGSMTILGEAGTVRVAGLALNQIQQWDFANPQQEDATITDANYDITGTGGFGHQPYYANVIATLRGAAQPMTDGEEGLKSLEILTAAYRSAHEGQSVSLPLAR
ncbi:MAG: Gfo/Idh/MocA family oxidoreductase [Pseudomonadota bacterium]